MPDGSLKPGVPETVSLPPLSGGERQDVDARTAVPPNALWIGRNVEWFRGALRKRPGRVQVAAGALVGGALYLDEYLRNDGTVLLIAACRDAGPPAAGEIYSIDADDVAFTPRTPVGGLSEPMVLPSGVNFQDHFYLTCGTAELVMEWDGTATPFTTIAGSPQCRFLGSLANHLVAAYITDPLTGDFPYKLMWSREGNPADWTTGDSGEVDLVDPVGAITGLWRYGDYLYVARERSIERMSYFGPPLQFAFQGVDAPGCVAAGSFAQAFTEGEPYAFYLGEDNLYEFNGIVARPLPECVRRVVVEQMEPTRISHAVALAWPGHHQYWLAFSSVGSAVNDRVLVWDYANRAMYLWELGFSGLGRWQPRARRSIDDLSGYADTIDLLTGFAGSINELSGPSGARVVVPVAGCYDSKVYQLRDDTPTDAGAAIPAAPETGLMNFGTESPKQVKRVLISADRPDSGAEVEVYLGVSEDGKSIVWHGPKAHQLAPTQRPWVDFRATGRWIALRLSNTGRSTFRISGLELELLERVR